MRKGPIRFQNPIDTILIDCGSYLSPLFRHLHFTPNTLTSISAIFGFMSVYKMYNKDYKQAGMLYFISYMFDCFDGFYARKYNMVTKYGDFYDHIYLCFLENIGKKINPLNIYHFYFYLRSYVQLFS